MPDNSERMTALQGNYGLQIVTNNLLGDESLATINSLTLNALNHEPQTVPFMDNYRKRIAR